jgi:hypothetical protein
MRVNLLSTCTNQRRTPPLGAILTTGIKVWPRVEIKDQPLGTYPESCKEKEAAKPSSCFDATCL